MQKIPNGFVSIAVDRETKKRFNVQGYSIKMESNPFSPIFNVCITLLDDNRIFEVSYKKYVNSDVVYYDLLNVDSEKIGEI